MSAVHVHRVQIYYEDTDHSGVVYHPNYFKYLERAREHLLGVSELLRLSRDEQLGFAVYRCEMTYLDGALFGDTIEIRSTVELESQYRLRFHQDVYRAEGSAFAAPAGSPEAARPLARGIVEMVCLNAQRKLVPLPSSLVSRITV
jgi:YbgC/YbaW family acyl-CoA thioester hydrolase